jgi:hypothetical protein
MCSLAWSRSFCASAENGFSSSMTLRTPIMTAKAIPVRTAATSRTAGAAPQTSRHLCASLLSPPGYRLTVGDTNTKCGLRPPRRLFAVAVGRRAAGRARPSSRCYRFLVSLLPLMTDQTNPASATLNEASDATQRRCPVPKRRHIKIVAAMKAPRMYQSVNRGAASPVSETLHDQVDGRVLPPIYPLPAG